MSAPLIILHGTSVIEPLHMSPQLAAVSPESPEVRRKRRRQLLFIDKDTQISQEEMRAQIDDAETDTRALVWIHVVIDLRSSFDSKTWMIVIFLLGGCSRQTAC